MFNALTFPCTYPFKDFHKSFDEILKTVHIRDIHLDQMDMWTIIHPSLYNLENNSKLYKSLIYVIKHSIFYKNHKESPFAYYPVYRWRNIIYWWGLLEQAYDNLFQIELTITDRNYSLHHQPYNFSYTLADKIILESAKITNNSYLDWNHCDLDDPDDVRGYKQEQYDALYEMACSLIQNCSFVDFTNDFIQEKFKELIQIGKKELDFTSYNTL